jgi:hypothetical protein
MAAERQKISVDLDCHPSPHYRRPHRSSLPVPARRRLFPEGFGLHYLEARPLPGDHLDLDRYGLVIEDLVMSEVGRLRLCRLEAVYQFS